MVDIAQTFLQSAGQMQSYMQRISERMEAAQERQEARKRQELTDRLTYLDTMVNDENWNIKAPEQERVTALDAINAHSQALGLPPRTALPYSKGDIASKRLRDAMIDVKSCKMTARVAAGLYTTGLGESGPEILVDTLNILKSQGIGAAEQEGTLAPTQQVKSTDGVKPATAPTSTPTATEQIKPTQGVQATPSPTEGLSVYDVVYALLKPYETIPGEATVPELSKFITDKMGTAYQMAEGSTDPVQVATITRPIRLIMYEANKRLDSKVSVTPPKGPMPEDYMMNEIMAGPPEAPGERIARINMEKSLTLQNRQQMSDWVKTSTMNNHWATEEERKVDAHALVEIWNKRRPDFQTSDEEMLMLMPPITPVDEATLKTLEVKGRIAEETLKEMKARFPLAQALLKASALLKGAQTANTGKRSGGITAEQSFMNQMRIYDRTLANTKVNVNTLGGLIANRNYLEAQSQDMRLTKEVRDEYGGRIASVDTLIEQAQATVRATPGFQPASNTISVTMPGGGTNTIMIPSPVGGGQSAQGQPQPRGKNPFKTHKPYQDILNTVNNNKGDKAAMRSAYQSLLKKHPGWNPKVAMKVYADAGGL
jgi:hypothetical protein